MNPKIISLIGIARRAGKVSSGESQVEALLKKKTGYLLIIAEDSSGAINRFSQWAEDINLPVLIGGSKHELGLSIGLSPRSVVLIMDEGFANAIIKVRGHNLS